MDIRLKRTLDTMLFPSPKAGMNPRSLAFLRMTLNDKRQSVLFATFPKSGWNWTGDILGYSLIRKCKGRYDVTYEGEGTLKERERKPYRVFVPADARSWDQRKIRDMFPGVNVDYCFHTHEAWKESPLWGLDNARTAFIVRGIPTTLYSFFKSRGDAYDSVEACMEKTGVLDRILRFYNSWGDFIETKKPEYAIFKYEDARTDPLAHFQRLYQFVFKEDVPEEICREALSYYSFENQKKREFTFDPNETKHFHFKGGLDYSDKFKPETLDLIKQRIKTELRHPFGYEY